MASKSPTRHDHSGRRRKITKFALAGVAVLGVGAALTSAAWSDSVWFAGTSSAATFELQGRANPGDAWQDADTNGVTITIPATALQNVSPNSADSYTVYLHNAGSVDMHLQPASFTTAGPLFGGAKPAAVSAGAYADDSGDGVLSPGEDAHFAVVVTGGNWIDSEYLGQAGSLTVLVQGQS